MLDYETIQEEFSRFSGILGSEDLAKRHTTLSIIRRSGRGDGSYESQLAKQRDRNRRKRLSPEFRAKEAAYQLARRDRYNQLRRERRLAQRALRQKERGPGATHLPGSSGDREASPLFGTQGS